MRIESRSPWTITGEKVKGEVEYLVLETSLKERDKATAHELLRRSSDQIDDMLLQIYIDNNAIWTEFDALRRMLIDALIERIRNEQ